MKVRQTRQARQGQPLVFAGIILGGWFAARVMLWTSPFATASAGPPLLGAVQMDPAAIPAATADWPGGQPWLAAAPGAATAPGQAPAGGLAAPPARPISRSAGTAANAAIHDSDPLQASTGSPAVPPGENAAPRQTGQRPYPLLPTAVAAPGPAPARRWRADGWIMAREGSGFAGSPSASRLPGYGGSQAGAVLRYRLAPSSARDPFLYARASRALTDGGETDVGVGAGVRPVASLPVTLLGELRITETPARTLVRPAVLAVGGLPPQRIDSATEAEAYAQAGYVGGAFATAFVDGQARIDRRIARAGEVEWRMGAGVWGGAQRGAVRLDVGPSASARFVLGEIPVRVSLDYRERVAGEAQPGSGIAVTVAGGF